MKKYTHRTVQFYDKNISAYIEDGAVVNLKNKLKLFTNLLCGKNILDVACGPGHDTDFFKKSGFDCIGIDLSDEMLKYAQQHYEGTFKKMDFFNLEFKKRSFDGLWCSSVFGHIEKKNLSAAIEEFNRVLRDKGTIGIISVKRQHITRKSGDIRTYTLYEENELASHLKQKGFRIIVSEEFDFGNRVRLFIVAQKVK